MAAAAWVHRRDQLDPCREGHMSVGAGDADAAGLERLAEQIQHRPLELGELVEKQDAKMSEADLARPDPQAAADERGHRGAVMRRAERPATPDLATAELSRDGGDHRHFERLARLERRENAGKTGGEQRFPGTWRAAHQQVVAPGRGDLERALGDFLALDLRQVGTAVRAVPLPRSAGAGTRDVPLRWASSASRSGAAMTSSWPAQLASLPCAAGQIRPLSQRRRMDCGQQHAGRSGDASVEAEFADRDIVRQRLGVGRTDRRKQPQRDREIVMRALLGQVGRRQVDRDDLRR